ncbi:MAG: AarF/ABC1/UbiB kinase family protein, partial [Spirochaetaceae bacterium]
MKKKTVFKRTREILSVLIRYGFSEILSRLKVKNRIKGIPVKAFRDNLEKPFAVRIRCALEELGPTFIKFGQMMSMRPDLFPQNMILELSRLQDQVPPFSNGLVHEIIESQFDSPFSSIFKSFEETPDAAASIAQVHRAILLSGKEVAVKIQRPGVHEQVAVDLEVLATFADLAERYLPEVALFHPKDIISEFSANLVHELDFLREARNIESFHKYFAKDPEVFIPDIFRDFCTEKILVMDYIHGIKISELDILKSNGYNCKIIAQRGIDSFFKQVFVNGFFHADPHSGNIFILPGNIIAPVDFGIVGFVNDFMRQELGRALEAFVARDARRLVKVLRDLELVEDASVSRELYTDIEHLITYYHHMSLAQLSIGNVINDFIDIVRKHHVRIP